MNSARGRVGASSQGYPQKTLCVDLDGALVKTDTLIEAALGLCRKNPLYLALIPIWLVRGRAYLKQQLARRSTVNPALLPYHPEFLSFLEREYRSGRSLVLATGADELLAKRVASHLGLFSGVLASDGKTNLTGKRKLQALSDRFGLGGFQYAGNSKVDLHIWRQCNPAILVNPARSLLDKIRREDVAVSVLLEDHPHRLISLVRAIRPHQWVKNLLLMVPLLTSHKLLQGSLLLRALVGIFAFNLGASSMYILNDLLDLESDRLHPRKRFRPFAAGDLSLSMGIMAMVIMLILSVFVCFWISTNFLYLLLLYLITTLCYSIYLKRIVLLDVLLLTGLYTVRVIAGGEATAVQISFWLLAFSIFLFLSLALVKRFSELKLLSGAGRVGCEDRDYTVGDLQPLANLGIASAYLSCLVLALYVNSPDVIALYTKPQCLWLICPLLVYWISRIWLLAHRGQMHDDPVMFALKDKTSYFLGILTILIMVLAGSWRA